MAAWDETFDGHAIHATIETIDEQLETLSPLVEDQASREWLERLRHCSVFVRQRLEHADKALCMPAQLKALNSQAAVISGKLAQAIDQNNPKLISNAVAVLDTVVGAAQSLPSIASELDLERIRQAQERIGETSSVVIASIEKAALDMKGQVEGASELAKTVDGTLTELKSAVEGQKGRLDEAIATFQKQFSDAEQARSVAGDNQRKELSADFKEMADALRGKLTEITVAAQEQYTSQSAELKEGGKSLLARMSNDEVKARELLQIATNIAVTGHFSDTANEQGKAADIWRMIALGFNLVIVGAVGFFLWETGTEGYSLEVSMTRLVMIAVLVAPARYASRESRRHRRAEDHNRRLHLELASIDPFLETLPPELAQDLKVKLADRLFGHANSDDAHEESEPGFSLLKIVRPIMPK